MALKEHSIVRRTKEQKVNAAIAATAVKLAKVKGDPLAAKLSRYRELLLQTRAKIMEKYYNRARAIVTQRLNQG